jgi:DNA ligase-associated metallophosphoesterase
VEVNGETLVLDPSGAAWWPAEETLVFADLHFEKGSAYARGGQFLPPYDTRSTIRRITAAIARYRAARVVALGDSFHDGSAGERLDAEECAALKALTHASDWLWVEGNHDPEPPAWLGGTIAREAAIGGLVFRHLPTSGICTGEIAGHLHPAVRIARRGMSLRRRCFVSDGTRLLLPAFGAYAGGLDVADAAVSTLFASGFAVYALGTERVYAVGGQVLRRKKNEDVQPSRIAIRTVDTP